MSKRENVRLDSDNIKRPNTKWVFEAYFNVDVKVILDRQPLLGTGPLPDWLRNLSHSRNMIALDTYKLKTIYVFGVVLRYTEGQDQIEVQRQHGNLQRVSSTSKLFHKTVVKHL